jgi:hypothetical protein
VFHTAGLLMVSGDDLRDRSATPRDVLTRPDATVSSIARVLGLAVHDLQVRT